MDVSHGHGRRLDVSLTTCDLSIPAFTSCGDSAPEEGTVTKLDLHMPMHMSQQRGATVSYHGYSMG